MKIQKILFVIIVLLIELAVIGPFFSTYFLSILPAATLYAVTENKIKDALAMVFALGFIVNIASFNRFPTMTTVAMIELGVVYFAKQKLVDFRNPIAIFLFVAGFSLLRFLVEATAFHGFNNEMSIVYSVAANVIFSLVLAVIIYRTTKIKRLHEIQ